MSAPTLPKWRLPASPVTDAKVLDCIAQLDPISLAELDAVRLLDRVDTKFLLTDRQLLRILDRIGDRYRILDATPTRVNRYQTLYFDTIDLATYQQHHNDLHPRYKIRCREYVDSGIHYMEIKCKTNRKRTVKRRMPAPTMVTQLHDPQFGGQVSDFVRAYSPFDPTDLYPCLQNEFGRITLVSRSRPERLTIDIGYGHSWCHQSGSLPGIVIAEVKQPKFTVASDFVQQLRSQDIRPTGFSKYCTGIIDLYPHVKYNRFKRRFLMLDATQPPASATAPVESA